MSPAYGIMGSSEILDKHGSTGSVKIGNTQKFGTSIDGNLAKDGDSTTIFSKLISQEPSYSSSADIYLCFWMDFMSNVIGTKGPNFVYLVILAINALYEFNPFISLATIVRRPADGSHCSALGHVFG